MEAHWAEVGANLGEFLQRMVVYRRFLEAISEVVDNGRKCLGMLGAPHR